MQVIYIDVLFLLNTIMNLYIFIIASHLLNKRLAFKKLLLGSLIASLLYCTSILIEVLQYVPSYIYYLFIPVIPILYMYKPNNIKSFCQYFLLSNLAAFLVGGTSFSIYSLTYHIYQRPSILLPISTGGILCIGSILFFNWIRKRFILPSFEYELILKKNMQDYVIRGIVDTGNCLYSLKHHLPVIIVTYTAVECLLTKEEQQLLLTAKNTDGMEHLFASNSSKMPHSIHLIPYHSVGCTEGVLIGLEWEEIEIKRGAYSKKWDHCLLGITHEPLFRGQEYSALLHPDYILFS